MPFFKLDAELWTLTERDLTEYVKDFIQQEMRKAVKAFLRACLPKIPVRTGFLKGSFRELKQEFGLTQAIPDKILDVANPEGLKELLKATKGTFKHADLEALLHRKPGALNRDLGVVKFADLFHHEYFKEAEHQKDIKLSAEGKRKRAEILERQKKIAFEKQKKRQKLKRQFNEYYYYGKKQKVLKTSTSGIPFNTNPKDVLKETPSGMTFQLDVDISYYRVNDFYSRIKGAPWGSLDAGAAAMLNSLEHAANRFPELDKITGRFRIQLRKNALTTQSEPNTRKFRTFDISPFE